ncbi:beta-ketoacyl [acyl carrier protein] synthase domain-containing protein [Kitasatospora sp. NBC_01266]|uniref:beta-ketoacyl [acyl carrier protein] synthase domain-containing protein n=1 Tax=Kitasatospora sp. NBC_01266 TaxID=2903572 RepID=UPI002E370F55|nr:beta-ketoacyl synthase N-terminal-like domain-containing protein [Kitasatospora sp. NBC_01266]
MNNWEILTSFKSGALTREHAAALLTTAPIAPLLVTPPVGAAGPAGSGRAVEQYAVTALHGRFPQAPDLDAFWRTAADGHDRAGEAGSGRRLEGVDEFDPEFFGLDPQDAVLMDPQERLFLEVAWHTLETAGYTGARLDTLSAADGEPRSLGVYVAVGSADYGLLSTEARAGQSSGQSSGQPCGQPCGQRAERSRRVPSAAWSLPNRLSALLDLRGPSQSLDTAESSFLVALHLALGALRAGECAAALVGAVDLRLHPARQSPEGGEGVGAVLIRPLAAAQEAGDTVHAVIRGAAVAHAGRSGPAAELRLARRALALSGIDASSVTLREDAGTAAATVGEAGAALGLAALVRAVLQLRRATLLPGPGEVTPAEWPRPLDEAGHELPLRAAVAIRGAGGTAAQVVLEEYRGAGSRSPSGPARLAGRREELVLLSAPTPEHLAATARRLAERLSPPDGSPACPPTLADVARELRLGRAVMACRLAVTVRTTAELACALAVFASDPDRTGDQVGSADLRPGRAPAPPLDDLPETAEYLAALWRGQRLAALARLWLAGVDVTAAGPVERAPVLPLPATALLRRPFWIGRDTTDGPSR